MNPRFGRMLAANDETLLDATVDVLAGTLGLRDGSTGEHSDRVVLLAQRIGERLGLGRRELRDLGYAARLHDIGKVGVPDAVLHKAGPLLEAERELIKGHSVWGADLVGRIPGLEYTRSFSRNGFAQVTAVFHDRVDIYFARQQVAERLAVAQGRLPAHAPAQRDQGGEEDQ